jgi:hypothetical protein
MNTLPQGLQFGATQTAERWRRAQISAFNRAESCSQASTRQTRILAWERLHGLQLPLTSDHPLLDVIARDTRLTLSEIHDEQLERRKVFEHAGSLAGL